MKIGVVYCIKCYETGKVYVGQTIRDCEIRVKEHLTREVKNSNIVTGKEIYKKIQFN